MMQHWIVLLCCIWGNAFAQTQLRIFHTNDMHSRFDQTSQLSGKCTESDADAGLCYGGLPRLLTALNDQRAQADSNGISHIFLNGGDTFQGTLWYTVYKWRIVAAFISYLGIDAMSLGNHEFDDGPDGLAPYLQNISIPVVSCNVNLTQEPVLSDAPIVSSVILTRGKFKIGVIGYLTPDTTTLSETGNVIIYDEVPSITAEAKKLKAAGVSVLIALGHSGYDRDIVIARDVPDVDIVVGGHSHSFLYTGEPPDNDVPVGPYPTLVKQASGRVIPVVQAYAYTKYLGILDVWLDDDGEVVDAKGQPLLLNSSIAQDQNLLDELEKWQDGLDNITQQQIGTSRVFLNGSCRFDECNVGNIITDALVDYGVRNVVRNWTEASISLYSGGGIRTSINSGALTREDIILCLPFYNPLVMVSLSGQYLLEALEWSVARYDPEHVIGRGEFLQVSGIHVVYDISQPIGSRVVSATARCNNCQVPTYLPVNSDTDYSLIVSSFVATGGDNFTMIADHGTVLEQFDALDTDIVSEYIQRRQLIYDGEEERIKFL